MFTESVVNHISFSKWWSILKARSSRHAKQFSNFMVSLGNCPACTAAIKWMLLTYGLV
jgi:hypothetical protein